jgi:hypothetical protein
MELLGQTVNRIAIPADQLIRNCQKTEMKNYLESIREQLGPADNCMPELAVERKKCTDRHMHAKCDGSKEEDRERCNSVKEKKFIKCLQPAMQKFNSCQIKFEKARSDFLAKQPEKEKKAIKEKILVKYKQVFEHCKKRFIPAQK